MNEYTLDLLETKIKRIKELEEENKRLSKNQRYYKNGVFSLENDKETMSDMIDDYKSRINEVIDDLQDTLEINEHIKIGNNELVQLDIDHIKYLIDKLKGEDNEN